VDDKILILVRHLRIGKEANASDTDDFDMEPTVRWEVSTREEDKKEDNNTNEKLALSMLAKALFLRSSR
jgi:hypothetical protein